ncbi:MAG TPA: AraC family transcriptional regulator, partial [Chitinophagaceae bacterium]
EHINESNKLTLSKAGDQDAVYYSELNEWFTNNAFRSFSIKYVIDQCIYYKVGSHEHAVNSGEFLIACRQPDVKAYFTGDVQVKSICIDISPSLVAEAFTIMSARESCDFDNFLSKHFSAPAFFETVCPVGNSVLSGKLKKLAVGVAAGQHDVIDREWFLDLAENVIRHAYGHYMALNGIRSVRIETRKELLRRLYLGKRFMDEQFLQITDVSAVARESHLSEFHFFRSFRQAFNETPYQYLLNKRLEHGKHLLMEGETSISSIAAVSGFADVFTFSKAFKRRFGAPPSKMIDKPI